VAGYKIVIRIIIWLLSVIIVFVVFANVWVVGSTRSQVFSEAKIDIEPRTVLVLGTSSKTIGGNGNPFFYERINTTRRIYQAKLAQKIILSGSKTKYYNEPLSMRKALVEAGIPDSLLISDSGGERTLDSIVRCKLLFKKNDIIIITQKFHAYRALFISNYYKMNAVVVVTQPADLDILPGVLFREIFARPLAVVDLYILHRKPHFETVVI
jgi:SanA protein